MNLAGMAVVVAGLLMARGQAEATLISVVKDFSLGPGETAFALPFAQFNPGDHAGPLVLREVTVTVTADFAGGLTLFNATRSPVPGSASLGAARVMVTPCTAGLLVPTTIELALAGTGTVPAAGELSLTATAGGSVVMTSTDAATLDCYTGEAEVGYDIDFTALYPQRVSTQPSFLSALVHNERMTGTVRVTYRASAPGPDATVLGALGAAALDARRQVIRWRTEAEVNLLGFLLDRRVGEGGWIRVTPAPVPAVGNGRGEAYRYDDTLSADSTHVRYRLLLVDAGGSVLLLGETTAVRAPRVGIALAGGNLRLSLTGEPNATATMEATGDSVFGPWIPIQSIQLDGAGENALVLPARFDDALRFYRLIAE